MLDVSRYIGIPFVERGRTMDGADCWGLVRLILMNEFGIDAPSLDAIEAPFDYKAIGEIARAETVNWIEVDEPQAGDLILFRVCGQPVHVGLVVDPGWMVHTDRNIQSCIERYDGVKFRKRIMGIFRHESLCTKIAPK